MKQSLWTVASNEALTATVWRMVLKGDGNSITAPGQFINIKLEGLFLRRPISVCDWDADTVTILYKVVGKGTEQMTRHVPGDILDVLSGLGNGYNTAKSGDKPLLIGGGVGVPPLYGLCKALVTEGKQPTVIMGFNTADEAFYVEEFRALSAKVLVATADGSMGTKGFVTDCIKGLDYSFFYTCGPEPMFRAISKTVNTPGQYSFEKRMGCGFGACMGCSCKTLTGNKRICKEGPVMESEEIIWEN